MRVSALSKKRWRDLWRLRGQVFAVAMVVASGVATLVMSISTVSSLENTTQAYYQQYHFAQAFASLTRAPLRISEQLSAIEGVQAVQTRISEYATVDAVGLNEPVMARLLSVPHDGQPLLNRLVLRQGSWFSHRYADEVIISEPFAEAHGLAPGDSISVIMRGNKRQLQVVGIALCPEFIYALGPGALLPDDKRFGVFWLPEDVLAAAYDLTGAFNDVAFSLAHHSEAQKVLRDVDSLLAKYGGTRAYLRKDQLSHWFVTNEIAQQKTMAMILPGIFITVAIFLTSMVLGRLIATERAEIGLLKAFGYSSGDIILHYVQMMLIIGIGGVALGCLIGYGFGLYNTKMYAQMFRFPLLIYALSPQVYVMALIAGVSAVLLGTIGAVKRISKLTPASAMQPPSPPAYRPGRLFSRYLINRLDQPTRVALRQIERWPLRSLATSTGVGFAVALVIMNFQWQDALDELARVYFHESQKQSLVIGLSEPRARTGLFDFYHLPGVMKAEPMRFVSVEFSHDRHQHRGSLTAISPDSTLQTAYDDWQRRPVSVRDGSIILTAALATKLNVSRGDAVTLELLTGRRPVVSATVSDIIDTYVGMPAYVSLTTLGNWLQQSPQFEFVNILHDPLHQDALFSVLKETPYAGAITIKANALAAFNETLVDHLMVLIGMFTILAVMLGVGVTYNSARIALSERGRELATLRVLGFTRSEIAYVLLGELALLTLGGLIAGCALGFALVLAIVRAFNTELFRIPFFIEPATYGWAVVLIFAASVVSALLVRRRIDSLDLIRVLKTRE
ncbi:ABC transporter permease [Alteromonas sp. CYL-A6]|uniref:ABC transporter permease n=1 Tax=Alteromonas nitratireducens TaxID=3390813 RepID=UPI0034ADCE76